MARISKKCPKCRKTHEVEFEMGEKAKGKKDFRKAEQELTDAINACECSS